MSYQKLAQQLKASKQVFEVETMERSMIACQLHENLAQTLSAMKMNLSALESNIPIEQNDHRKILAGLIELVDNSCKELKSLSQMIMPQTLLRTGLVPALQEYIYQIEQTGIKISFYADDLSGIAGFVAISIYKVVREIVENSVKLAAATCLDIALVMDPDGLSVIIETNATRLATKANAINSWSLENIGSRIEFLNGTVECNSSKDKGSLVAIHIPKL